MNPVQLWPSPPYYPHTCIRCGCGAGQRKFFVDLGINLTGAFNPMYDGSIYYCDECASNLIGDINRVVGQWFADNSPWESPDRAVSSYNWQQEIDVTEIENEIESRRITVERDPEADGNDIDAEQDDSVLTTTIDVPEPTVSTDDAGDAEPKRSLDFTFGNTG